mmetsp:Transcript_49286/g.157846  ORF Transcript_49286/g.157846 Transcript_49286/m.157846 type:complete len:331 (-) Transcript_49286:627-1619(-)
MESHGGGIAEHLVEEGLPQHVHAALLHHGQLGALVQQLRHRARRHHVHAHGDRPRRGRACPLPHLPVAPHVVPRAEAAGLLLLTAFLGAQGPPGDVEAVILGVVLQGELKNLPHGDARPAQPDLVLHARPQGALQPEHERGQAGDVDDGQKLPVVRVVAVGHQCRGKYPTQEHHDEARGPHDVDPPPAPLDRLPSQVEGEQEGGACHHHDGEGEAVQELPAEGRHAHHQRFAHDEDDLEPRGEDLEGWAEGLLEHRRPQRQEVHHTCHDTPSRRPRNVAGGPALHARVVAKVRRGGGGGVGAAQDAQEEHEGGHEERLHTHPLREEQELE